MVNSSTTVPSTSNRTAGAQFGGTTGAESFDRQTRMTPPGEGRRLGSNSNGRQSAADRRAAISRHESNYDVNAAMTYDKWNKVNSGIKKKVGKNKFYSYWNFFQINDSVKRKNGKLNWKSGNDYFPQEALWSLPVKYHLLVLVPLRFQ